MVQTSRSDAFGVPAAAGTQGTAAQPFGYAGEQRDAATGFAYLRARTYDPQVGRFLQRDPFAGWAAGPQGLNRYAYVANNPVNLTDPSGNVCVGFSVSASFAAGLLDTAAAGQYGHGTGARLRQTLRPRPQAFGLGARASAL